MEIKYDKLLGDVREKDAITAATDARYLMIDQTSVQSVINGSPKFQAGITIKAGQKLIFDGS